MSEGFEVTVGGDSITVRTDAFTLVFDKHHMGITSFKYVTDGAWHEGVETGGTPPILFGPYFKVQDFPGDVLYPMGGTSLQLRESLPWFVRLEFEGYLRNQSIPNSTDYPLELSVCVRPSGSISYGVKARNNSIGAKVLLAEGYRLNPANDADIHPGRDDAPELKWFGFYSANGGGSTGDRSHDAIAIPFETGLDEYAVQGNTNRIYRANFGWAVGSEIVRYFLLALSGNGSWGDCANADELRARGDALSSDYTLPDPLDGSTNAGRMLVGTLAGDGFDEEGGNYGVTTD